MPDTHAVMRDMICMHASWVPSDLADTSTCTWNSGRSSMQLAMHACMHALSALCDPPNAHACVCAQAREAGVLHDPSTWNYDQFVQLHKDFGPSTHTNTLFLPWHRQLLLHLERALQSVDPTVMLPYWDASLDHQVGGRVGIDWGG